MWVSPIYEYIQIYALLQREHFEEGGIQLRVVAKATVNYYKVDCDLTSGRVTDWIDVNISWLKNSMCLKSIKSHYTVFWMLRETKHYRFDIA